MLTLARTIPRPRPSRPSASNLPVRSARRGNRSPRRSFGSGRPSRLPSVA